MSTKTTNISGSGFVSEERTEDGLLKVHGVALGENDITRGHLSGERKLWRPEVLEQAGAFLEGKDIVADHENQSAYKTIGRVTDSAYKPGVGVIYQGVIQDEELEPKIQHGWLDVSPRILHSKDYEEVMDDIKAPEEIFDLSNLSVVRKGASHSNELNVGEHDELSVEELQAEFDEISDDSVVEYQVSVSEEDTEEELQEESDGGGRGLRRWMYDNRNAARGAGEEFGCSGTHSHEIEGNTWFMPCPDHDTFLRNLAQKGGGNPEEASESEESEVNEEELPDENVGDGEVEESQETDEQEEETEVEELSESEKKRIAGQLSSWSRLKREEALSLLEAVDPDSPVGIEPFKDVLSRVLEDVDDEEVEKALDSLSPEEENSKQGGDARHLRRMFR